VRGGRLGALLAALALAAVPALPAADPAGGFRSVLVVEGGLWAGEPWLAFDLA
jgi:hypothetical protein